MIKKDFHGSRLSLLGFGAMRLPQKDGQIDEKQVFEMTEYAMANGVNYFDTAYPYHNGNSERVMGRALKRYPRESFYLATKYPGHQISSKYDPAKVFEEQLEKCGVEYFDFYLLHNVYERSVDVYKSPRWGILDYFREQKRQGRIRHLGFSTHGGLNIMEDFLDYCNGDMEFCQIQLNYLDWTLQGAKEKYEMLKGRGIPVWVMEPLRGGRLADLNDEEHSKLRGVNPEKTAVQWAFEFLMGLDNVGMILSGMSEMGQMQQNTEIFKNGSPLSANELEALLELAEGMKKGVPCTQCRYCTDGCPVQLDIPMLLSIYNEMCFSPSTNASMRIEALSEEKRPSACIECGQCAGICPQSIEIPEVLKNLTEQCAQMTSWEEISRQR